MKKNKPRKFLTISRKNQSEIHEFFSFPFYLSRKAAKIPLPEIQHRLQEHGIQATLEELDALEILPMKTKIPFAWVDSLAMAYEVTESEREAVIRLFYDRTL